MFLLITNTANATSTVAIVSRTTFTMTMTSALAPTIILSFGEGAATTQKPFPERV